MRGAECLVVVSGEVDLSTAREFRDALLDAVARAAADIVVDMRDVGYLDSTGVHALLDAAEAARGADVALRVAHPQTAVRRVLELSGVTDVVHIEGNSE